MLSAAYQQSSRTVGQAARLPSLTEQAARLPALIGQAGSLPLTSAKLDPENKLLWRMPTKRLEAEVIRDCILAVSGRLDSVMGGPPILLVARPDGLVVVDESKLKRRADANKRSVYLAVAPGVQPFAAHRFRPPSVCRQLSQARRLGDPIAIADDAQRPIRRGRGGPLRRPRRLTNHRRRAKARSDAPSRLLSAARPTTQEIDRCTAYTRPPARRPSKRQAIPTATPTARPSPSCATRSSTRASSCTRSKDESNTPATKDTKDTKDTKERRKENLEQVRTRRTQRGEPRLRSLSFFVILRRTLVVKDDFGLVVKNHSKFEG